MVVHLVGSFLVTFTPMFAVLIWAMNRLAKRDPLSLRTAKDFAHDNGEASLLGHRQLH